MKKQNKLSIKFRDLEPLKDVTGGRQRRHGHLGQDLGQVKLGIIDRRDSGGLGHPIP